MAQFEAGPALALFSQSGLLSQLTEMLAAPGVTSQGVRDRHWPPLLTPPDSGRDMRARSKSSGIADSFEFVSNKDSLEADFCG